jgi:hypothetical protein
VLRDRWRKLSVCFGFYNLQWRIWLLPVLWGSQILKLLSYCFLAPLCAFSGLVDPRTTESRQKEYVTWKSPRILPEIEPGTYRLVAQCLNQMRYSSRPSTSRRYIKCVMLACLRSAQYDKQPAGYHLTEIFIFVLRTFSFNLATPYLFCIPHTAKYKVPSLKRNPPTWWTLTCILRDAFLLNRGTTRRRADDIIAACRPKTPPALLSATLRNSPHVAIDWQHLLTNSMGQSHSSPFVPLGYTRSPLHLFHHRIHNRPQTSWEFVSSETWHCGRGDRNPTFRQNVQPSSSRVTRSYKTEFF